MRRLGGLRACEHEGEDASEAKHAPTIVPAEAGGTPVITAAPAVLASCPKTYAIAAAGKCSLASVDKLTCSYPDGHCSCLEYSPCSGWAGAYEEAHAHPKAQWGCTPKVRPDGCLGDQPTTGSHCGQNGKECAYGSCGGEVLVCRDAAWAVARELPPPP